uniref:Uncharacterized protein n=1 Tax=Anopheles braziliensis TaxID=58242 RepID=A0A2M3ZLZ1_9DIPT
MFLFFGFALGPQHRNLCSLCSLGCSCTGSTTSSSSSSNAALGALKFWGRSRQGGPWTSVHTHTQTHGPKKEKQLMGLDIEHSDRFDPRCEAWKGAPSLAHSLLRGTPVSPRTSWTGFWRA